MVPNLLVVVQQAKRDHSQAWKDAHTGNAHTEDFIKILAARCHAIDPRFGLNGKRGNPADLSDDALNFVGEGGGTTPDGRPCSVIDVIGAAGSAQARPQWIVFSQAPDANGAWVKPGLAPEPDPPHVCPPPVYPPYPVNEADVDGAGVALFADFTQAQQSPNPQMFRFAFRIAYNWLTKQTPDLPSAEKKVRKEWRDILGLPPL